MSTDLTVALTAPDRPLGDLLEALELALVERAGLRHDGSVLRCEWQADSETFDEVSPDEELGPSPSLAELAEAVTSWGGFSSEWWNELVQVYVLVARVHRPGGAYVNAWVTIPTGKLQRLARDEKLPAFHAVVAEVARAIGSTAGYGHFELAYEPLAPERAERAIMDLPEYPGEAATLGVLPLARGDLEELQRSYEKFEIIGTTAGYWVLVNRDLVTWLGK